MVAWGPLADRVAATGAEGGRRRGGARSGPRVAQTARRGGRHRGGRLTHQLLQHRQHLFGVGVTQEHDTHVVAGLGATIQVGDDGQQALYGVGVAPQQNRIAAVDRHDGDRATAALALGARRCEHVVEDLGDLAGRAVGQGDGVDHRPVLVDLGQKPANAPDIVGIVSHHHDRAARIGHDLTLRPDQRLEHLHRAGGVEGAQTEHLGGELPAGRRRLTGRVLGRLDAVGAVAGRRGHEVVGPQGGEEHLEQLATVQRPVAGHGHRALDAGIDDEGRAGRLGDVLDEDANVRVLDIE